MGRIHFMTIGLLLVLVGIQFYMIRTYVLTNDATRFLSSKMGNVDGGATTGLNQPSAFNAGARSSFGNSVFSNSSYRSNAMANARDTAIRITGYQKQITPPSWLKWATMFLGAVLFLHGAAIPRN